MIDKDSVIRTVAALILRELIVNKLAYSEVELWDNNDKLFEAVLGTVWLSVACWFDQYL